MINYSRAQMMIDKQIRKAGGLAYLRRNDVDRECYALEVQLSAHEKRSLKNFTNRVFTISAVGLDVPPTKEDSLVLLDASGSKLPPLRQDAPVAPFQPKPGGEVVYYEIQVS